MRKPSAMIAVLLLIVAAMAAYSLYTYTSESKNISQELAARQDYQIAVGDASRLVLLQPIACFVLVPMLAWLLALVRFMPQSSVLRNFLSASFVLLLIFTFFIGLMGQELKNRDATYVLPPELMFSSLSWAALGVAGTLLLWFAFERFYVAKRIAPDA